MNLEDATSIIIRPYITEKTFAMVENEQKICFLVKKEASKLMIQEAVKMLYHENSIDVHTSRTIYGKKAFAQFETVDDARDLASKLGVL